MSAPEFLFTIRLAGRDQADQVVGDVAASVFQHVGCTSSVVAALVHDLNAAVISGVDRGAELAVQFRAGGRSCEVIVSVDDREIWRTSRRVS